MNMIGKNDSFSAIEYLTFIREFSRTYVKIKEGRQFKLGLQFDISLVFSNGSVRVNDIYNIYPWTSVGSHGYF